MNGTITLWRPVGSAELQKIIDSGMRAFPPRLPGQPIFYPVLNAEYARQIASEWNAKDDGAGFVTEFDVDAHYLSHFEIHRVGSSVHDEYWIPAESLGEFNDHIQGGIRVLDSYFGPQYTGPRFEELCSMEPKNQKRVIAEGRFLRLVDDNGWEYVERKNTKSVVAVVNRTKSGHVLFVEQFRPAVNHYVIEWPAGLVGDEGDPDENMETAAKRELLEETGYAAERIVELITGPSSTGVTSEEITYVMASGLEKKGNGGGVAGEKITVHEVPASEAHAWLTKKIKSGVQVDPRVYVGLYFMDKVE